MSSFLGSYFHKVGNLCRSDPETPPKAGQSLPSPSPLPRLFGLILHFTPFILVLPSLGRPRVGGGDGIAYA